jgi:hypothetical protein
MNDVMGKSFEENPIVQIEISKNPKGQNEKDIMQNKIKIFHVQRKYWKPHGKTSLNVGNFIM